MDEWDMHLMESRRAPLMIDYDFIDLHPDPLWISGDHPCPEPGWLFLVAYGPNVEDDIFRVTYTLDMDQFWDTHQHIPLSIRYTGRDEHAFGGRSYATVYHHPSEEWIREVARQLIAGERAIRKINRNYAIWSGDFTDRAADIPVCTVEIYRKGDKNVREYVTSTLVQELKTPSCIGCGGAEGRWEM
jgi:hypothetical protein